MSESTSPAVIGEVRSAAQVLKDDVMCQSFIQGSSTLAYACLLIRKGQYELAGHVLRQLEVRKSGRYRDIVFYIQSQMDMELGLFDTVKTRLVDRLKEHPADMVALSLLQACIQAELLADGMSQPDVSPSQEAQAPGEMGPFPSVDSFQPSDDLASKLAVLEQSIDSSPQEYPAVSNFDAAPVAPPLAAEPVWTAPAAPKTIKTVVQQSATAEVDLMPFQAIIQDTGTKGFIVWESRRGASRKEVRDASIEALVSDLPQLFPGTLAESVRALDSGKLTKSCFSFGKVTVTTLHHGHFHCGIVTGPLNQSLIAMVRTETLFAKRASQLKQAGEFDGEA